MINRNFVLAPAGIRIAFEARVVPVMVHSLSLLGDEEEFSGFAEWVIQTSRRLSPADLLNNHLFVGTLDDAHSSVHLSDMAFPEYIAAVEGLATEVLFQPIYDWLASLPNYPGHEVVLHDEASYVAFMRELYIAKDAAARFKPEQWSYAYSAFTAPDLAKARIVGHLRHMWANHLEAEWKRVQPMLNEAVAAFRQVDFNGMDGFAALEFVTGRDMRGNETFDEKIRQATTLIFIPSPYLGPYISGFGPNKRGEMRIFFGARLPQNTSVTSSALSRNDLLVRLNALADDTRLRMLEMLTQQEEICAQDFMSLLDLSQSSASRHLRQLTAAGYLTERRRDIAKCYSLNRKRMEDTLRALEGFLQKK